MTRPSLRTFVIAMGVLVLAMPVAGVAALRVFENVLHRQTESKLIAEAAYVQALYVEALRAGAGDSMLREPLSKGLPRPSRRAHGRYEPFFPALDVSRDPVLPPPPDGRTPPAPADPAAVRAGAMIQPVLKRAQLQSLSAVRVLDCNGVVVSSTGAEIGEDLSDREEVASALAGEYRAVLRQRAKEAGPGVLSRLSRYRIFAAQPMIEEDRLLGVVYVSRTGLSFFRDLWEGRYTAMLVAMLAVTVLLSFLLSTMITRPLTAIARRAEIIAAGMAGGAPKAPMHKWAPREAHQLDNALTAMVDTLEGRMRYVQEFARSVSHELKAPLTGIRGSVELLREGWREMPEADRERFLRIIAADAARMERLVRRLLELARLETAGPAEGVTELRPLLEDLVGAASGAGREVRLETRVEAARARIPADMAEALLSNLIENAVLHGKPPAEVTLGKGPRVTVRDHGPGIPTEHLPHVFERFFTTARDRGGTGLGLSIVKAIADTYGAAVTVRSDGSGTEVTVDFKAA